MPDKSALYDQDFYAWSSQQAALLRAGELRQADIAHIAEEIESMGRTEKRELISRLTILLLHLIKWRYPAGQSRRELGGQHSRPAQRLADHLDDNPSLRPLTPQRGQGRLIERRCLRRSRKRDCRRSTFPEACPWTFEQALDAGFWPG